MRAGEEFRDRDETEVAVLDALVDRPEEGMTVFELRSRVESDIDDLETALSGLKADGLIDVDVRNERTVIKPDDRVTPTVEDGGRGTSIVEWIRNRLPP